MGTIHFTLEEKSSEISFKDGETVLEALQREEVDAPFSCEGGFCGTCKAMVEEGTADMGDNDYLSEEELEEGWVLACQAQPKTEYLKLRFEE